jgi:PAS domain S-box-containing protein
MMMRDITKRKHAEEEIRMLAHTLKSINDCVNISDINNKIISVNKAFCDVYGYGEKEIIGTDTSILWSHLTKEELTREILPKTLKGGWHGELYNRRKDGSDFPIYLSTSVIRDEKGKPIALVGVSRDITEQKRAQEEKEKLQAQLLQAQKMEAIGTLAGGIAHDFNNILTPILGYVDMVQQDISPDSEAYSDLEHVLIAANRAKDLVQQILTFSRQVEKERKPVKIHLMVKEALKLIRATLPATINIRQNIDTSCKAVLADPVQIHQVLMNLGTNAYYAMRENGGVLDVKLTMVEVDAELASGHSNLKEGKYVQLTVSDTGHGMDSVTMERIFEPFFTTKDIGEGTGLGLSVVHGIVVSHGGEITVESKLGKGTTFKVYWPQADSDVEQMVSTDEPIPKGNEHILFIDDEEEIAFMGKRMLERLGYKVTVKTNSLEVLKTFQAHPDKFDLVITDQTMPNMTGLQLAEKLLHFRSDIPIILITGFSEKVTLETAKKMGISEYIMKPIVARDLGKIIRQVLDKG